MDRRNGNVDQEILSKCDDTFVCLVKHPNNTDSVLEGCPMCGVIRSYNIHTGQCNIVHSGSRPCRMYPGSTGFIWLLALKEPDIRGIMELSKLNWEKEQQILVPDKAWETNKGLLGMCYIEQHDILVCIYEHEGLEAVRLDSELSTIWRLSGLVDGLPVKPDSITCDTDGNAYVGDGPRSRIIRIDSFTGDIITVLQLGEENQMQIRSLFWSNNEPSLTVVRGDEIGSFYTPQLV